MDPLFIGIIVFLAIFVVLFFVLKPLKEKTRSAALLKLLNGKFRFPLGTLEFQFSDFDFSIVSQAIGGGTSHLRSCPVLVSYLKVPFSKFIIGHSDSKRFTLGQFLILPPSETLMLKNIEILVGSTDSVLIEKAKQLINKDEILRAALEIVFQRNFAHLTISKEIHVGGPFLFHKQHVLRYVCLPVDIYKDAQSIVPYLKTISDFIKKLD